MTNAYYGAYTDVSSFVPTGQFGGVLTSSIVPSSGGGGGGGGDIAPMLTQYHSYPNINYRIFPTPSFRRFPRI